MLSFQCLAVFFRGVMYSTKEYTQEEISKDEKENLATQLAIELPALRGKVGASQEEIASAVGISRQTYSAYENRTRPIPWSLYLALLFYFDYIPSTHYMIRQLELFPNELDECWLAGRVFIEEEK